MAETIMGLLMVVECFGGGGGGGVLGLPHSPPSSSPATRIGLIFFFFLLGTTTTATATTFGGGGGAIVAYGANIPVPLKNLLSIFINLVVIGTTPLLSRNIINISLSSPLSIKNNKARRVVVAWGYINETMNESESMEREQVALGVLLDTDMDHLTRCYEDYQIARNNQNQIVLVVKSTIGYSIPTDASILINQTLIIISSASHVLVPIFSFGKMITPSNTYLFQSSSTSVTKKVFHFPDEFCWKIRNIDGLLDRTPLKFSLGEMYSSCSPWR